MRQTMRSMRLNYADLSMPKWEIACECSQFNRCKQETHANVDICDCPTSGKGDFGPHVDMWAIQRLSAGHMIHTGHQSQTPFQSCWSTRTWIVCHQQPSNSEWDSCTICTQLCMHQENRCGQLTRCHTILWMWACMRAHKEYIYMGDCIVKYLYWQLKGAAWGWKCGLMCNDVCSQCIQSKNHLQDFTGQSKLHVQ